MDTLRLFSSLENRAVLRFSRSGGPGGQNLNKVNTRVTLCINLDHLEGLSEAETARLREELASRLSRDGRLIIHSSEERSQKLNLERALSRAKALIAASARLPKKRRPVKPSRAAREKRLESKRMQGRKKAQRRFPDE